MRMISIKYPPNSNNRQSFDLATEIHHFQRSNFQTKVIARKNCFPKKMTFCSMKIFFKRIFFSFLRNKDKNANTVLKLIPDYSVQFGCFRTMKYSVELFISIGVTFLIKYAQHGRQLLHSVDAFPITECLSFALPTTTQ